MTARLMVARARETVSREVDGVEGRQDRIWDETLLGSA